MTLCANLTFKLRFLEAWTDEDGHSSGIMFMALKQLETQTHTYTQGIPLSPINPQLSTASRFQSGLSQQTEGIIYPGKEKGTSGRERSVCYLHIYT